MEWTTSVLEILNYANFDTTNPDVVQLHVLFPGEEVTTFCLHKSLLDMSSGKFKDILKIKRPFYVIENVKANISVFNELVKHIYMCGDWKFNGNLLEACSLLKAAMDFGLEELRENVYSQISRAYLEEMINATNACYIFDVVRTIPLDWANLKNQILLGFICKNAEEIFRDESFLSLSIEGVVEIIKQDAIEVESEVDIFKAVLRYVISLVQYFALKSLPS